MIRLGKPPFLTYLSPPPTYWWLAPPLILVSFSGSSDKDDIIESLNRNDKPIKHILLKVIIFTFWLTSFSSIRDAGPIAGQGGGATGTKEHCRPHSANIYYPLSQSCIVYISRYWLCIDKGVKRLSEFLSILIINCLQFYF